MNTIQQNPETCKCAHDSHVNFCFNPDCAWVEVDGITMELCTECYRKHINPKLPHRWNEVGNSYLGGGESEYRFVCEVCHVQGWYCVNNETGERTSRFVGDDEPCAKTARQVLIARLSNSR